MDGCKGPLAAAHFVAAECWCQEKTPTICSGVIALWISQLSRNCRARVRNATTSSAAVSVRYITA
jgi:hypothetical protein